MYGCLVYLLVAFVCGLPAAAIDEALFSGAFEGGTGPLFGIVGLGAFVIGLIAFFYFRNPNAAIWGKAKELLPLGSRKEKVS